VHHALRFAGARGWRQLVLSTQPQMTEAQSLYEAAGFRRRPERDWGRGASSYLAYTMELPPTGPAPRASPTA
jgi:ribosomal protein S18 acetylase RimI-like enzyme